MGKIGVAETDDTIVYFAGYHAEGRVYPIRAKETDGGVYALPASRTELRSALVHHGLDFERDVPQAVRDAIEDFRPGVTDDAE